MLMIEGGWYQQKCISWSGLEQEDALSGHKKCEEIMKEPQVPQVTVFIEQSRINWKGHDGEQALTTLKKKP